MRLIDADSLTEKLESVCKTNRARSAMMHTYVFPVIEEYANKYTGRWVWEDDGVMGCFRCSECGHEDFDGQGSYPYCPGCGSHNFLPDEEVDKANAYIEAEDRRMKELAKRIVKERRDKK